MSYQTWKSYTKIVGTTAQEREDNAAADARELEELNEREESILSWKAGNGSLIEVYSDLSFAIDGSRYWNCQISAIPTAQAAKMAAAGIVATFRSETGKQIGLTAERKAALESL